MIPTFSDSLFGLSGKVAAVIGGSGVLGGALARALASAGARVAILYSSNEAGAIKNAQAIQIEGGEAEVFYCDIKREKTIKEAVLSLTSLWGAVDILVNAPGVNSPTPVMEITEEEWNHILDTNLKGVFLASRIFGASMIERGAGGSIINISSVSSNIPLSKVFTYSISKAGINNMTQFLAREWAPHGVRVNAIIPGFFPAEQNRKILTSERKAAIFRHTPMNRYGEVDELSGVVIWLASRKASSFVTGACIPVDGGFSAMTI
jgi:NAD(P)-dependent dehydrogenase (short-subunit alcohol dehydrogenase family)